MGSENQNESILDRYLLVYEVRMDEMGDRWAVIYAEPEKEGEPSAKYIVERAVEVSPLVKKCWKSIDARGNRIGYFWEYIYPVEYVPNEDYYNPEYYIDQKQWSTNPPEQKPGEEGRVVHDDEATYQAILQDMIAKYLIVKYSILDTGLEKRLEETSAVDKRLHTKELAEEAARQVVIKGIPEGSKAPATELYEGGWDQLQDIAEAIRVYKRLRDERKAHEIAIEVLVATIITIATFGTGSLLVALGGAVASSVFSYAFDPKEIAENILNKEQSIYTLLGWTPEVLKEYGEEVWGDVEAGREGLKIDKMALKDRELEISSILPWVVDYAFRTHGLDVENKSNSRDKNIPLSLYDYFDKYVKSAIFQLMGNLLAQPNPLVLAYDLLEYRLGKDGIQPELINAMNEYIDQSYWRFVPNDAAAALWATILNIKENQFRAIAPKEEIVRLQKTAYDPWIVKLKEEIGVLLEGTEVDPGEFWARLHLGKSSSKEALETSALPQGSMEQPYAREMEGAYAQASPPGTEASIESSGGGAWGPAALLSLAMYGALPEQETQTELTSTTPAGGDGVVASPVGQASSLSLPSFPSVSLPSLGAAPSALPSPVGLGGVGGVPSTPSVGLPSVGGDGAAMPAPSIGLSRLGRVSTPAMPAMGAASPMGMPGGPAIPSSAPSAPVSAQGGPSGGGGGFDFASLLGGSRQSMIPGSQGFAGTETAEAGESLNRAEKLVDRLMQIPDMLAMAESSPMGPLGSSGKSAGDVSQRIQPQQPVRMVINRHEEISKEKLEQYVTAWLESQSRVG